MKKMTTLEQETDQAVVANNVAEAFEKELVELINKYNEGVNESTAKDLAVVAIKKVMDKHSK